MYYVNYMSNGNIAGFSRNKTSVIQNSTGIISLFLRVYFRANVRGTLYSARSRNAGFSSPGVVHTKERLEPIYKMTLNPDSM